MIKKAMSITALSCAVMLISGFTASAAQYTVDAPSAGIFGRATSVSESMSDNVNKSELDKSKNSALIPPLFGSPTSNMRYTGEPLTPNLADIYANKTNTVVTNTAQTVTITIPPAIVPNESAVINAYGEQVSTPGKLPVSESVTYDREPGFTMVSDDLYYSGGHIGTLKIPDIDVSAKIYEGTTNSMLAKGAGHFKDTSIWNGNVCLAAHNRGTNAYFGKIHTLDYGSVIELTTKIGTKKYEVFNIEKISVNDTSNLQNTGENIITLITCVKNEADYYRWCVQGKEIW